MNIGTEKLYLKLVDGEEFYILTNEQWQQAFEDVTVGESVIFDLKTAVLTHAIVKQYPEIALSIHSGAFSRNNWWQALLFRSEKGRLHRVNLQREACLKCGWSGDILTPMVDDLYIGCNDIGSAMKNAKNMATVGCPKCKGAFPSFVVWTEPFI